MREAGGEGWLQEAQTLEAIETEFEPPRHRCRPCVSLSKTLVIWELSFRICRVGVIGASATGLLEGVSAMSLQCVITELSFSLPVCKSDSWHEGGGMQSKPRSDCAVGTRLPSP